MAYLHCPLVFGIAHLPLPWSNKENHEQRLTMNKGLLVKIRIVHLLTWFSGKDKMHMSSLVPFGTFDFLRSYHTRLRETYIITTQI